MREPPEAEERAPRLIGIAGLALLSTRETAEAEARAIAAGTSGATLMERAGAASARVCQDLSSTRSVAVICGPGNNGGDGFVIARILAEEGWQVAVFALDSGGAWTGEAGQARARWSGPILDAAGLRPHDFALVVDALFGAGLARSVEGAAADLIGRINDATCTVVAIDIPSGVDGTTGEVRGIAIDADVTVTFGTAKPGHYLYPGRSRRGRLVVADIGLAEVPAAHATMLNAPALWRTTFPWPEADGHKYTRGHAVVVSGGLPHTGAARLAARSALRIGAGLVTLASPTEALAVNASHLTAVMLRAADGREGLAAILDDPRMNGVVLGPGLGVGSATRAMVAAALAPQPDRPDGQRPRACLLDADALTSFAGAAEDLRRLIAPAPGPVVITPHDGEFARLFGDAAKVRAGSKLDRARAAAHLLGCVVLLKGPDTVVAAPDGRAAIADGGSPWLATAGSGDVLSGMIGGLLTQGMPPFEAAAAGDYLHTAAARLFGPGLIAEDLPEMLPKALSALWEEMGFSGA